jgi:hypothetical protein
MVLKRTDAAKNPCVTLVVFDKSCRAWSQVQMLLELPVFAGGTVAGANCRVGEIQ